MNKSHNSLNELLEPKSALIRARAHKIRLENQKKDLAEYHQIRDLEFEL